MLYPAHEGSPRKSALERVRTIKTAFYVLKRPGCREAAGRLVALSRVEKVSRRLDWKQSLRRGER